MFKEKNQSLTERIHTSPLNLDAMSSKIEKKRIDLLQNINIIICFI